MMTPRMMMTSLKTGSRNQLWHRIDQRTRKRKETGWSRPILPRLCKRRRLERSSEMKDTKWTWFKQRTQKLIQQESQESGSWRQKYDTAAKNRIDNRPESNDSHGANAPSTTTRLFLSRSIGLSSSTGVNDFVWGLLNSRSCRIA